MAKTNANGGTKPKVSIVVPIYNVEKYLRECVDSILAQTLKDIEVILVDDGSPDGSPAIVDEYAKADKRVVPIHKENGGYSKAVNYGISIAKGEYIGVIESDDWIEPDMYEKLYASAKKYDTDVTKSEFYYYNSTIIGRGRNRRFVNGNGAVDLRDAPDGVFRITDWPELIAFHASIWSCIYRADFIKKIKLIDTAGASYQDFPFMVEVMCKAKRISIVKKPMVHWRNDPKQGNSTSQRGKKLLFMPENTINAYNILVESGLYEQLKEAFYAQAAWANYGFFMIIDKKYKEEYFNKLVEIFAPLKGDAHFAYRLFDNDTTNSDSWLVYQCLNCNYKQFKRNDLKRRIRGKCYNGVRRIMPTYRAVDYIKGVVYEMKERQESNSRLVRKIAKLNEEENL